MEAPSYDTLINRHEITDAAVSAFADSSAQIPEEYIRTEEVLDGVVVGEDESYELPVVDMSMLLDPESSALETKKLGAACRNWGFFQLTNHGVEEAMIREMKDNMVQFFSLPLASKKTVAVRENVFEGFGHHYSRATVLLSFMAADLGVEEEALQGAFSGSGKRQSMAIHYYPPCRHPEKVIGTTPHTDGLGLTLLLLA